MKMLEHSCSVPASDPAAHTPGAGHGPGEAWVAVSPSHDLLILAQLQSRELRLRDSRHDNAEDQDHCPYDWFPQRRQGKEGTGSTTRTVGSRGSEFQLPLQLSRIGEYLVVSQSDF